MNSLRRERVHISYYLEPDTFNNDSTIKYTQTLIYEDLAAQKKGFLDPYSNHSPLEMSLKVCASSHQ